MVGCEGRKLREIGIVKTNRLKLFAESDYSRNSYFDFVYFSETAFQGKIRAESLIHYSVKEQQKFPFQLWKQCTSYGTEVLRNIFVVKKCYV